VYHFALNFSFQRNFEHFSWREHSNLRSQPTTTTPSLILSRPVFAVHHQLAQTFLYMKLLSLGRFVDPALKRKVSSSSLVRIFDHAQSQQRLDHPSLTFLEIPNLNYRQPTHYQLQ
jgi:hypothetical protein